jgi:hypothetical protein
MEMKNVNTGADMQTHFVLSTGGTSGSMGGITWAGTNLLGEQEAGFIGNSV